MVDTNKGRMTYFSCERLGTDQIEFSDFRELGKGATGEQFQRVDGEFSEIVENSPL